MKFTDLGDKGPEFKLQSVAEASPRVDSLVTDALKLMQGTDVSDAVQALKTVLGDREYNSRRGHYNFYVKQLVDMSSQQGVAEGSGDPEITPGMKTQYGTVVKVKGNTVIIKASNGELTTMNIHDIQQGVAESDLNEKASQLLSAQDRNGVITVVVQAPDGTKRSLADENPRYINQWLMKYDLSLPRSITSKFVENDLNEFAPAGSSDGGDDGFSEETLKKLAAQWWNGDEDPTVEKTLLAAGWEIGQDEGYDNGGVFVVMAGDEHGKSYISWPAEELQLDEASLAQMRDYFSKDDADSVRVDRNYDAPSKKQNPLGIPPEIQALVNKMYHAGKITPQEFEILRKFQQRTKINVGIREADANPYAIGMSQAMKSTGDKPPLKKSTINKAHKIARAIEKDE